MIVRDTPKDKENYVLITDDYKALSLQEQGISPKYMDENGLYFAKSDELDLALNNI